MLFDDIEFLQTIGDGKKKAKAKYLNMLEFQNNLTDMTLSAMNELKFDGLPETCDERTIQLSLLTRGCFALFEKDGAIYSLPFAKDGNINIYGRPAGGWVYSRNGECFHIRVAIPGADDGSQFISKTIGGKEKGEPQGVVVYDNDCEYPFMNYIIRASESLTDVQRTLDVLAKTAKSPVIISTGDDNTAKVKQILENIDANTWYVIGPGKMPVNETQVFNTGMNPDIIEKLWTYKQNLKSEYKERIGLNSLPTEKRERMLTGELSINDETVSRNIDKRMKMIKEGLDLANKVLGTSISVRNNEDEIKEENRNEGDDITEDGIARINSQQRQSGEESK